LEGGEGGFAKKKKIKEKGENNPKKLGFNERGPLRQEKRSPPSDKRETTIVRSKEKDTSTLLPSFQWENLKKKGGSRKGKKKNRLGEKRKVYFRWLPLRSKGPVAHKEGKNLLLYREEANRGRAYPRIHTGKRVAVWVGGGEVPPRKKVFFLFT